MRGENRRIRVLRGDFVRLNDGHLAAVEALHERYRDRGLAVVVLVSPSKAPAYAALIDKRGLAFPVAIDNGQAVERYFIKGAPTYFLIDRHGKMVNSRYVESAKRVDFPLPRTEEIERLLEANAGSAK